MFLIVLIFFNLISCSYGGNSSVGTSDRIHRIAFGSCHNPNRDDTIWSLISSFNPNQLLLLGDQIYGDFNARYSYIQRATPDILITEYEKIKNSTKWNELVNHLTHSWMATYDDHDYGINNGDKTFIHRNKSLEIFSDVFYTQFNRYIHLGDEKILKDGVYSSQIFSLPIGNKVFKYKVILLDARSNKDVSGTPNGDFLGHQQWKWLEKEFLPENNLDIDMILLGSGIQVLPSHKLVEESWHEFPLQREKLLNLIYKASLNTNVFILSGDIHSAEISQANCSSIAFPTKTIFEFTSSGLSHTFKKKTGKPSKSTTLQVPQVTRGFIPEILDFFYQFGYPSQYRQHKYQDTYGGIHFALLDILHNEQSQSFELRFQVIGYDGNVTIDRIIPLTSRNSSIATIPINDPIECVPYWGETSWLQFQLFKAEMIIVVSILILLPSIAILWLIIASVWYIFVGSELKRRRDIEDYYQRQLNKRKKLQ